MIKKLFIIIFFIILVFCGCKSKIENNERNNIFNFTGTWKIDLINHLEKDETEEDSNYMVGDEIELGNTKINIAGIYKENINYKLKAVKEDYTISYESNLTMNDFMNGREYVDLIAIIDKNQIIAELFLSSEKEMIFLYKGDLLKLSKVSNFTNFNNIKENSIVGNVSSEEKNDVEEGVMLGIKTPCKNISDGVYSDEIYKTIWISHKNWEVDNIYIKHNIIFPRLNGIWKLHVNKIRGGDFEYDEFQVGKYDEKLKLNVSEDITNVIIDESEYKTIKFVGNDYIAIGKYKGNCFDGNYPIYQIIPINNINIENGLQIDEIFTVTEKEKYLVELQKEINSLSNEERENLNISSIDYNNIAIERKVGRWRFIINLLPKNMSDAGKSFKLSILPDSRFINYNSMYISWKSLKQQLGFFKDAFISPLYQIALIQFDTYIGIYKIENGNLITEPLVTIPINENDEVIMAEWCSGSYVEQWKKAFVDGELIYKIE